MKFFSAPIARCIGFVAATTMVLGAAPGEFDLGALSVGKPVVGLVQASGRPLVIVAFASWCGPCTQELPQAVADYNRFKGRVDFLGVDYLDNPPAGDKMVATYRIRFPVIRSRPNTNAPPPADPNEKAPAGGKVQLIGVTPDTIAKLAPVLESNFSGATLTKFKEVAAYCGAHGPTECLSYAAAHDVVLSASSDTNSPEVAPAASTSYSRTTTTAAVDLPHLFIVDAQGIVRADVGGYDTSTNAIAEELAKLGIK